MRVCSHFPSWLDTKLINDIGEGNFDDANAAKQSGAATPLSTGGDAGTPTTPVPKRGRGGGGVARGESAKGTSKRAKTTKERLRLIDGDGGLS